MLTFRQSPDQCCEADGLPRRGFLATLLGGISTLLCSGCVPQLGPYQAKAAVPPPIKNCFDTIGHQAGFKPFVLGGNCYCNPTPAQIAVWQKEGSFEGKSADEIMTYYTAREVKTVFDHKDCNNMCEWGPHVAKGGKCLVPPTPMTDNYEEVATGLWNTSPDATPETGPGRKKRAASRLS